MKEKLYDLTAPQKSILVTEQYFKGSSINHICGTAFLYEKIDFDVLEQALNLLVKYNDSLRIRMVLEENEMKQTVNEYVPFNIETVEVSSKDEVSTIEANLMKEPFDMYSNLFTCKMFRMPDGSGGFSVNIHHLVSDSWTLGLVAKEVVRIYSSIIHHEEIDVSSISSYVDYISAEQEYRASDKFKKDKAYWDSVFESIPESASIPSSKEDADSFSCKANRLSFTISKKEMEQINTYCKDVHISAFNFFMGVYSLYISRVSRVNDFVIGTPILNRTNFDEKNTMGMFINTAPLRICINNDMTFPSFVSTIAKDSFSLLRHQKYCYQTILDDLRKTNPNLPNLYNILISYQITKTNIENGLSYDTRWAFNGNCSDDIDIHLYDLNSSGNMDIAYDYNISKYTYSDIDSLHNRIMHIVKQIIHYPNIGLNDIEVVTNKEKYDILYRFNNTDANYEKTYNSILEPIQEICAKFPDKIAIEFEQDTITYHDLWNRVNKLANYLVSTINISENPNIGILTTRSVDTIIGILAILRLNCTYVPIDPEYPTNRISYMIEKSKIKTILSDKLEARDLVSSLDISCVMINFSNYLEASTNFDLPINYDKNHNLYIIFTSGSTGKPKGVTISHKNMINLILFEKYHTSIFKNTSNHKILQFATMSFDVSYQEIYSCFLTSSTLVLITDSTRKNINLLTNYITEKKVDILFIPPAYLKLLCEDNANIEKLSHTITNIITAGEALIITDGIQKLLDLNIHLHNHYGPAETHVATTYTLPSSYTNTTVPIGYPIANSYLYVLDESNNLCPINTIGQIAISGECVGNGYFNNDDLTNEKFIKNSFHIGHKIYLTGDLGFFDDSGLLHYVGRSDFQVKINGFRIELSEIDKILAKHSNILNCITTIQEKHNKKYIISFYTSTQAIEETSLKDYLRKSLPNFMIPNRLVKLDFLPINNNGKIDKKSLPEIDFTSSIHQFIAPKTSTEIELANIWKNLFQMDKVGANYDFFEVGGDSLLAIKLSSYLLSTFQVEVSISDIFAHPILTDMSCFIDSCTIHNDSCSLKKAPNMNYYPLSNAQQRIYYACKAIGEDTIAYNLSGAILFDTLLDEKKVFNIFKQLIFMHSSFRTSFQILEDIPYQVILEHVDFKIDVFEDTMENMKSIINNFPKPFCLENAPLLRICIYYLDHAKTLLLIDSHHIILDGASLDLLIDNFCKLYLDKDIVTPSFDYIDYSYWEENYLTTLKAKDCENYWLNRLKGSTLPTINLPYDFPIPSSPSFKGDRISITLPETFFSSLDNLAKKNNVSSYMLFLAVFYVLLYKYTSQNYIVIGTPIANRSMQDLNSIIGMFVNNIVLDINVDPSITFKELLNQVKEMILNALHYQPYPYNLLVKNLSKSSNLFDVMFIYQNTYQQKIPFGNIETRMVEAESHTSKFNLSLEVIPHAHTIHFDYCVSLFKKKTIYDMLHHYINLLESICIHYDDKVSDLSLITETEKFHLLCDFNNTKMNYPKDTTIVQQFEKQVQKTSNTTAIICKDTSLTYFELNNRANQLAWYLKEIGIKPHDIVGISMYRSVEILIGILAVLKIGATYLPIDPTYPETRIKYMLKDSNVNVILTKDDLLPTFSAISNTISIELETSSIYKDFPTKPIGFNGSCDDLAYIIYTSGSTGNPKGVMVTNKNVISFTAGICDKISFRDCSTIVSVTTMCFDIFVLESLLPLQLGLTIVMANEEEQNIAPLLNDLCLKNHVDMLQTTPSRMSLLMSDPSSLDYIKNLKCIMLGGEPFPIHLLKDLQKLTKAKIFNMYGPTETTVWSTVKNLTSSSEITIGTPIANTSCYILDNDLNPVPIGLTGNLYIGGDGVTNGYLHRENLTKEKFILNPFTKNELIYNTGDLAYWNPSGEIICIGRSDFQVKLHGLRIELEEIENKFLSYPNITRAIICVKEDTLKRQTLCGYFIANARITTSELKNYLGKLLPNYMIPSYLLQLDDFKYTPNGKIDRNALPSPKITSSSSIIAPETQTEKMLLGLFEELLCLSPISITDNFFEIGGDSILALKLQTRLMKQNVDISYSDIYKYSTIKDLALKIESSQLSQKVLLDDSYDFTNINKVLALNTTKNLTNLLYRNIGNVLLTGCTGFLGIHILAYFLEHSDNKIYCLMRKDPSTSLKEKLLHKLHFYFNEKYDAFIGTRIIIVNSDITISDLGLSKTKIDSIFNDISCVINSAAIVKHYGYYSDFEKINVNAVKHLAHYCEYFHRKLVQISTISVSGNTLTDLASTKDHFQEDVFFEENSFYIGQDLSNVYVRSKYEAEKYILEEIYANHLDALILRIGNITNRSCDGLFQANASENAFMHRIEVLLDLGIVPDYLLNDYVEFSPVDLVAEAVVRSIEYSNNHINILHIYNPNHVFIRDLIRLFPKPISIVSDDTFKETLKKQLLSNSKLVYITSDLDKNYRLIYSSNIKIKNSLSKEFFDKINFKWNIIDKTYISQMLKHCFEEGI